MSVENNQLEGEELLKSVLHKDGKPVIVSRWGYHIEDIDGKKVLVASTKEELEHHLQQASGDFVGELKEQLSADRPMCGGVGPSECFPYNGCRQCRAIYTGGGYYNCVCTG